MRHYFVLLLTVISGLVYSETTKFYVLNSKTILKITMPDYSSITDAIQLFGNQILIQDNVIIQLLPADGQTEVAPVFEELDELISFSLTEWFENNTQELHDAIEEPLSYVAPIYEGPGSLTLFDKSTYCIFAGCNERFLRGKVEKNQRTGHHKDHMLNYLTTNSCPVCGQKFDQYKILMTHISKSHFKQW